MTSFNDSEQTKQNETTEYPDKNGDIIKVGDMLAHEDKPDFTFGEVILNNVGIPMIVADKLCYLESHYAQCIIIGSNTNKYIIVKKIAVKLPMLLIILSVAYMFMEAFRIQSMLSLP